MAQAGEPLTLEVATPTGKALNLAVESVQVPGVQGELGVLPRHLPLLAALRPGVLRYREGGRTRVAAVGTGFVEVGPANVRLLTDRFAAPEAIQREAVDRELGDAEARLRAFQGPSSAQAYEEIEHDVAWAQARLEVLKSNLD
jgi:F-type H+-transporting ATPase subunit epsilon